VNELGELKDLFAASVGSAAALIGLLFVSITVAPERVFGELAERERRAGADRAFTALGNVFFVSLSSLLPHSALRVIEVVTLLAVAQTVRAIASAVRQDRGFQNWRQLGIMSLGIYLLELWIAHGVETRNVDPDKIVYIVLGLYAYALATSWMLLGARDGAKNV
jgi:hypothetical protein